MATCSKCGTKVGCGCQLKGGLCASCRTTVNNINVTYQIVSPQDNVNI